MPKYENLGFPEEAATKSLRREAGLPRPSGSFNSASKTAAISNSSCSYRLRLASNDTSSAIHGHPMYLTSKEDEEIRMNHEIQQNDQLRRQCWCITKGEEDWYHITVVGAVEDEFLGVGPYGMRPLLVNRDFGNGRQRWLISKIPGNRYFIKHLVFDEPRYLGVSDTDYEVDVFSFDETSHWQQWEILGGCKVKLI